MEFELTLNNIHLESLNAFQKQGQHLKRMAKQIYKFESSILEKILIDMPGIYNLGRGRQVGKTTLLKQWMLCRKALPMF